MLFLYRPRQTYMPFRVPRARTTQGAYNRHLQERFEATRRVAHADVVVVATPVYKAAYSGVLKVFLDLLPQFALRDKVVLPLATGGSSAHVLAVDYALRPVLASLAASSITPGWFVLASQVNVFDDGEVLLDESAAGPLKEVTDVFLDVVAGRSLLRLATVREAVA